MASLSKADFIGLNCDKLISTTGERFTLNQSLLVRSEFTCDQIIFPNLKF